MTAADFLEALAIVLGVAAATTILFHHLRQPVVLGYLLAGLVIGPHVPVPLVADPRVVLTLSELGVILLMFSLGLEFRLGALVRTAPTAGVTAVIQCSAMVWLGYVTGRAFGWTALESVFAGAIIAISSTTIIAKAFDEQLVRGRLRELVVAILIAEDLIAVLLMAALTTVASGAGLSAGALAATAGTLIGFLAGLLAVGLLVVPRLMRAVVRLGRPEITAVTAVALCFAVAHLAHAMGYSVALGAFIAGSLVAESGEGEAIEHLLRPLRDVFAAVFFVSVGMIIDPALVVEHAAAIAALTAVVIAGKLVSVTIGAFLTGNGVPTSVAAGMSLAQIGEFSFIIAGLGLSLGATRDFLYPVAVAVSAITTLTTPWLIRASSRGARWVDRRLPGPLQTFAALYASWIERLRHAPRRTRPAAWRIARYLALDAALVAALVIGTALALDPLVAWLGRALGLAAAPARVAVIAAAALLALPFCLGLVRLTSRLAGAIADAAVPLDAGLDRGRPPRRVLTAAIRFAGLLLAGAPIVALTQPFLPGHLGALVLLGVLGVLGAAVWRGAAELHGHVRAGAHVLIEALTTGVAPAAGAPPIDQVHQLLPGIGEPIAFTVPANSPAIGRSLADLDVRGATGATILAITRRDGAIALPGAEAVLAAGDHVAIAGSAEARAAAVALLGG